jgi:hypothetical protein
VRIDLNSTIYKVHGNGKRVATCGSFRHPLTATLSQPPGPPTNCERGLTSRDPVLSLYTDACLFSPGYFRIGMQIGRAQIHK